MNTVKLKTGHLRPALVRDAKAIQALVKKYADRDLMLHRALSELYETIRQYIVYEVEGELQGCVGLHITWEDLGEVRGLAVAEEATGQGVGSLLVESALTEAKRLGLPRVFALTYVPDFFVRNGFALFDKAEFPHKIWSECIRCHKFPDCDETGMIITLGD